MFLHVGPSVSLGEYLVRVLVYLLLFSGIGLAFILGFRVIGTVCSVIRRQGKLTDSEP